MPWRIPTPAPECIPITLHSETPVEIEVVPLPIVIAREGDILSTNTAVIELLLPELVGKPGNTGAVVSLSDGFPLVEIRDKGLVHPREAHMMVAVSIPLDGDVRAQGAVVAPACQILPLLRQGKSIGRVLQDLGPNAEVIPSANSAPDTSDAESLLPRRVLVETETFGACDDFRASVKDTVSDEAVPHPCLGERNSSR